MSSSVVTESSYSITFDKAKGEKIGVTFTQNPNGDIAVGKVRPNTAASKTSMKEGDKIVSIDGQPVDVSSPMKAAGQLRNASGNVEIVLEDSAYLEGSAAAANGDGEDGGSSGNDCCAACHIM